MAHPADDQALRLELGVPGTPEQVWEAIATGPGITAWFMPADVDGREGGTITHHHGADESTEGTITVWEPPHRLAYEEAGWIADGPPITTGFAIEPQAGGTCVVRVAMHGLGSGPAWEQAIESFRTGWLSALRQLQLYLAHFPGLPPATVVADGRVAGPAARGWAELTDALGLPSGATDGERLATGEGAPRLAGRVERSAEGMLSLLLEEPSPGIGFIGAGGPGDEVHVFVRLHLFGDGTPEVAAREEAVWRTWMAERFGPEDA